jgi:bifunctional UDP-N-acetylglucosamine pyrophosphorylase/glucosamine-1-phosphate N-acetyltransferase
MKAILLLAGQSKRFWPLQEKTLFPICGTTLLDYQVSQLQKAGFKDILLVGGRHNLMLACIKYPKFEAVEQENLDLGMQGALLSALPLCKDQPVMIVSGNDVIDHEGYTAVLKEGKKKDVDGALLAYKVENYFPGGYLTVQDGKITGIVEKPGEGNEPSDYVNIVAHYHADTSMLLKELKHTKSARDDAYEVALQSLFEKGIYRAAPYMGIWQAVKYPWHLLQVLPILLQSITKTKIHKSAQIHKSAVIDGPVTIEEGVKVLPHATVKGPCVIGAHTTIGNNCLVRGSSIGKHCVIGYNTEVKSSVLADHVWTHSTYLGDSIIADNVAFGAGCTTGNFRLDEGEITSMHDGKQINTGFTKLGAIIGAHCRVGIQVGTNPGVKIGRDSFIVGGTFVMEDIPSESFVRMKDGTMKATPNKMRAPSPKEREKYFR